MEIVEKNVPYGSGSVVTPETFHIYTIGDIHAGSINCSESHIQQRVKEIQETPNAFFLGMGDYADCILKDDKRFDIVEKKIDLLDHQLAAVIEDYEPRLARLEKQKKVSSSN